jgi:hypothetical protein
MPGAPTATTPTPGAPTTPAATPTPSIPGVNVPAALQCGKVIINNNLYLVTVTTTTTTTSLDAPPAPPATSAIGRPLHVRGSASARHRRPARARRAVGVQLSGRTGYAKRVVRVRLVRKGDAGRR